MDSKKLECIPTYFQHNPNLAQFNGCRTMCWVVTVSLGGFEKVKAAIDKMTADLEAKQEEEVKLKAYCTKEINQNE